MFLYKIYIYFSTCFEIPKIVSGLQINSCKKSIAVIHFETPQKDWLGENTILVIFLQTHRHCTKSYDTNLLCIDINIYRDPEI